MSSPTVAKVMVRASARLHLGFIDLHGGLGRKYGSLGVSLEQPLCVVEVTHQNSEITVSGEHKERVYPIAKRFLSHFEVSHGVLVTVWEIIPEHVGLGSGTQLGLAIGTGITKLIGKETNPRTLAEILERGVISGVGTATFTSGGFVVDGGKISTQLYKQPERVPPLIIRHDVPTDWNFVVAIPNVAQGLSGVREARAFLELPSASPESAGMVSRLVLMKLVPALVNDEIDRFGEALTQIQILVGDAFTSAQGGRFAFPEVNDCVKVMLDAGAKGGGQSSWGPTCYGLVRGAKEAAEVKQAALEVLDAGIGGLVFVSAVNNSGARITMD